MDIPSILSRQKAFFRTQTTKDLSFRIAALKKLREEIIKREKDISQALYADFKKSEFEAVLTETGYVLSDLNLVLRKLAGWTKPRRVLPVLLNFPSTGRLYKEPYGSVLIIAPWNYPFQLVFSPLIGAIAAGNTAVVKPSELTEHTSRVIREIIAAVFRPEHVTVVEGGVSVSTELLNERWDYIFFTGSIPVGRIVAKAAAENLTPVTLELGGKSPCIIDETADLRMAAKRIVWGKFVNCGQTCIAPDYILVQDKVKDVFTGFLKDEIDHAYGRDPKLSADYCRIINKRNFDSLEQSMAGQKVLAGGITDGKENYISPTLVDNPSLDSKLMQQEIFGPVLPILAYNSEKEIDGILMSFDKPLALYVFSKNAGFIRHIIRTYSFGGGTINDTLVHFADHRLPFGGVGLSGIGAYHGKRSFDTFSFEKGITTRYNWLDLPVRYAPYSGKMKLLRFFLKWFG